MVNAAISKQRAKRTSSGSSRSPGVSLKKPKQGESPTQSATASSDAESKTSAVQSNDINMPHLIKLTEALGRIRQNPLFKDIEDVAALSLAEGASVEPFDQSKLKIVFDKNKGESETRDTNGEPVFLLAGANFFLQDFLWTPTPGVPINKAQMSLIKKTLPPMDPPEHFPYTVSWAIPDSSFEVLEHKGSICRLSPDSAPNFGLGLAESHIFYFVRSFLVVLITYVRTHARTNAHTHARTHACTDVRTYVRTYVRAYLLSLSFPCARRANECPVHPEPRDGRSVCTYVRTYIRTYVRTYVDT